MAITFDKVLLRHAEFSLAADVTFADGLVTALIGPSGGGKSTALAAIAGFQVPDAGRILLRGVDMRDVQPVARPVTILFQEHNLFPHLKLWQNVGLGLSPDLRLTADDKVRVEAALDEVDLSGMSKRRPAELSGGQRQRVALARALLRDKPILLLDEPFAGLGPAMKKEMLRLVERIATERALTVLMVTHHPADAAEIAKAVSFVGDGLIEAPVETEAMFENPTPGLRSYLGV